MRLKLHSFEQQVNFDNENINIEMFIIVGWNYFY